MTNPLDDLIENVYEQDRALADLERLGLWTYDVKSHTYLYGEQHHGAGVYCENGEWYGNVSANVTIHMVGKYSTIQEAKQACLDYLRNS